MSGYVLPKRVKRALLASAWIGGTILAVGCLVLLISVGRLVWMIGNAGH